MSTRIKQILSVVVILTIVFSTNIFSTNISITLEQTEYTASYNFLTYIKNVLNLDNEIISSKPLYNNDDDITGYCFLLSNQGYAITDLSGTIIEAQFEPNSTYNILNNTFDKKIYYGGPFNYYKKFGDTFVNILDNTNIEYNQVIANISRFEQISLTSTASYLNTNSARQVTFRYNLDYPLPTISYNPENLYCSSTAIAIVLHYLDDYRNSALVPDELDDETGVKLVDYLIPLVTTTSEKGIKIGGICSGAIAYLESQNINTYTAEYDTSTYKTTSSFFETLAQIIEMDYPIIVIFEESSPITGHYYVIHGLLQDVSGGQYYLYLNNGYGSNNVMVNFQYKVAAAIICEK